MQNLTLFLSDFYNWLKYFTRFGEIPVIFFSVFPVLAAVAAFFSGCHLLKKLAPGMVCRASLGCDRCELLYAVGLGSMAFSLIYIIMELRWLIAGNYLKISSLDELLRSTWEASVMFFLAWISFRSTHCLDAHCSFDPFPVCKGRNHKK